MEVLFQPGAIRRRKTGIPPQHHTMTERTVEDRLRAEYFTLLPDARRILEELEAEVWHCLLPLLNKLDKHEKLTVTSRIAKVRWAPCGGVKREQSSTQAGPTSIRLRASMILLGFVS
jgi:NADH:ubiquinone oxidoreductase subunit D